LEKNRGQDSITRMIDSRAFKQSGSSKETCSLGAGGFTRFSLEGKTICLHDMTHSRSRAAWSTLAPTHERAMLSLDLLSEAPGGFKTLPISSNLRSGRAILWI
jgi:hypothetical protein